MTPKTDGQALKKYLRGYFILFGVQVLGIALVVGAYAAHLPRMTIGATMALLAASVFGGFILHQVGRRSALNATFLITAFLLMMLMLLTIVAFYDKPLGTIH